MQLSFFLLNFNTVLAQAILHAKHFVVKSALKVKIYP